MLSGVVGAERRRCSATGWRRSRLIRLGGALMVALVVLTGCQVHTTVAVTARPDGSGTVGVTVSFDQAAVAALGGASALSTQLRDQDLRAAGWVVRGPAPGPGGTTVVSVTHGFANLAQASALVGEVAGSGSGRTRPFQLSITTRRTLWQTTTTLTGTVDLRCGLNCFGDQGLQSATGSPVGVPAGPLSQAARETAGQLLTFEVTARLPGELRNSNALMSSGGVLHWDPTLGGVEHLSAETRIVQTGRIRAVEWAIAGAAGLLVLGSLALVWRFRRRRRRARADREGAGPGRPAGRRRWAVGAHSRGVVAAGSSGSGSGGSGSGGSESADSGAAEGAGAGTGPGPPGGSSETVTPRP